VASLWAKNHCNKNSEMKSSLKRLHPMKRNTMHTVFQYAQCLGGMLFLGFVLVGTAAASGPATLFKSLEVGVGPSSCLPQARAA
jgi:hypothetical protein